MKFLNGSTQNTRIHEIWIPGIKNKHYILIYWSEVYIKNKKLYKKI